MCGRKNLQSFIDYSKYNEHNNARRINNIFLTLSRFNLKLARCCYFFLRAMLYCSLRAGLYSPLHERIGQFQFKPYKKLTNFNFQPPENIDFTFF